MWWYHFQPYDVYTCFLLILQAKLTETQNVYCLWILNEWDAIFWAIVGTNRLKGKRRNNLARNVEFLWFSSHEVMFSLRKNWCDWLQAFESRLVLTKKNFPSFHDR